MEVPFHLDSTSLALDSAIPLSWASWLEVEVAVAACANRTVAEVDKGREAPMALEARTSVVGRMVVMSQVLSSAAGQRL